ncbi:MAG: PDZ domain-containing protein [Planctomycetia bacterium]|nr:PDZ domain-containing protein [Planctomycetia bacterium]
MKIFTKSVMGILLLLMLIQNLEAQTIHVITVGDFRGFQGGALQGIRKDISNITAFFQRSVPTSQLNIQDVEGDMATPNAILRTIENIQPSENDTIVFYYTGHAANDSTTCGQFFQLRDEKGEPTSLSRSEVRNKLLEKNCRLTVLLTDCCNVFDENGKMGFKLAPVRSAVNKISPFTEALFVKSKGLVDVTSSKIGQYSYALKDGSIFTVAWVMNADAINAGMKQGEHLTWRKTIELLTVKSGELFKECYPQGTPQGQNSQIPHAYTYPEMPPRLGITALTQSVGNVRVTEVAPGLPGEKAGLKVGDVITHINGEEVLDEPDYARAIDQAPQVSSIRFTRNGQSMEVRVELNGEPVFEGSSPSGRESENNTGGSAALDPNVYGGGHTPRQNTAQVTDGPVFGVSVRMDSNMIVSVIAGSPAAAAGLSVGDQILLFNDRVIRTGKDFEAAVDASAQVANLTVQKRGMNTAVSVRVVLNKSAASALPAQPSATPGTGNTQPVANRVAPVFGVSLQADGNLVVAVTPNSPAAEIGIEVNDRILKINDVEIRNGADFSRAVDLSPRTANVVIRDHRKNQEHSLIIQLNK